MIRCIHKDISRLKIAKSARVPIAPVRELKDSTGKSNPTPWGEDIKGLEQCIISRNESVCGNCNGASSTHPMRPDLSTDHVDVTNIECDIATELGLFEYRRRVGVQNDKLSLETISCDCEIPGRGAGCQAQEFSCLGSGADVCVVQLDMIASGNRYVTAVSGSLRAAIDEIPRWCGASHGQVTRRDCDIAPSSVT